MLHWTTLRFCCIQGLVLHLHRTPDHRHTISSLSRIMYTLLHYCRPLHIMPIVAIGVLVQHDDILLHRVSISLLHLLHSSHFLVALVRCSFSRRNSPYTCCTRINPILHYWSCVAFHQTCCASFKSLHCHDFPVLH